MNEYRVASSGKFKEELKKLCGQAHAEGRWGPAKAALEDILRLLEVDPLSLGEAAYDLEHAQLQVRHAVKSPWSIYFAVDEKRRIVYLKHLALLP